MLIIAIICIIDTILVYVFTGAVDLGTYFPGLAGVLMIVYILFKKSDLYLKDKGFIHKLEKYLIFAVMLFLISFIFTIILIVVSAKSDYVEKTDCIIVLGAGLRGEKPTLVLVERLNKAIDYIKITPDVKVIVSGGKGFGEDITEAEAMKKYLLDHGVDENIIIKEEKATSTFENYKYSIDIYKKHTGSKLDRAMIVTSDFHMFRSKFLAGRMGIKAFGISSKTPFYIYPNVITREYFAIIKSIILDK